LASEEEPGTGGPVFFLLIIQEMVAPGTSLSERTAQVEPDSHCPRFSSQHKELTQANLVVYSVFPALVPDAGQTAQV
jgi:hypothetical protein